MSNEFLLKSGPFHPPIHLRRYHQQLRSLLTQDVLLTSIQRRSNVMDVRWTLKQRCVLTGLMS